MRRHAIVPKGWQSQWASHLLLTMLRQAVVPDVIACKAAVGLTRFRATQHHAIALSIIICLGDNSASGPYILFERCIGTPLCRRWSPTPARPKWNDTFASVGAKGVISTGRPYFSCERCSPYRRTLGEKGRQQQPALPLVRARQRHAIARVMITGAAAVSTCEKGAGSTSKPYISCGRRNVMPWCWW